MQGSGVPSRVYSWLTPCSSLQIHHFYKKKYYYNNVHDLTSDFLPQYIRLIFISTLYF